LRVVKLYVGGLAGFVIAGESVIGPSMNVPSA
jgi:hypothetical protein